MSSNSQQCSLKLHRQISISGPDAFKFLQGQCTCDLHDAENNQIVTGAHCTPKGRILFNFILIQSGDNEYTLRLRKSVLSIALTSLKKYATFFKVTITEGEKPLFAVLGGGAQNDIPDAGKWLPQSRSIILNHGKGFVEYWGEVPSPQQSSTTADSQLLDLHLVKQGIVEIEEETSEKFTPHDINFQLVGGISFSKGCYTGQEVIARMHYKATLKKHSYYVRFDTPDATAVGHVLLQNQNSGPDGDRAVAQVVAAAFDITDNSTHALIVTHENHFKNASVFSDEKTQAKISWPPQPYAIT